MKQVLQHLGSGALAVADVPAPGVSAGSVLLRTQVSLISPGTERMLVAFGRGNWLSKLRQQPEKVRQVLGKLRSDGLRATIDAVRSKLDQPLPLGYCNVGRVIEVGHQVSGFAPGDRVVSNGRHAEVVCVPRLLCARIPDAVDDDSAAFTVLAAIALNSVRLAQPTLGETVVVTGLGAVGLLAVQLLRANGCRVLGIDRDAGRVQLARQFGAETVNLAAGEDPLAVAQAFSRGRGVDAVILAAASRSDEPIAQAAQMCRQRGRLVLVGVVGLNLSRADFYAKELTFQVACSYGPGRHDPAYEEQGHDYPLGLVRWTEQRNFEAVLDLMAAGTLQLAPLVSQRFAIEAAGQAYDLLAGDASALAILLDYPQTPGSAGSILRRQVRLSDAAPVAAPALGFIGAGNYAGRVLLPAFRASGAALRSIVSANGVSALHYGRKFGAAAASTDTSALLADSAVDAVVIATRHDSHARLVCAALAAGKHVFVEKPLCLDLHELAAIESAATTAAAPMLMVGFNRRYAPLSLRMKALLQQVREPKNLVMTVNAGALPAQHWAQDPAVGGGRLLGEACHFIDLLRFLVGAPVVGMQRHVLLLPDGPPRPDNASIVLHFADGSIATLHYFANGHNAVAKERLEVYCGGRILQLDNFRRLRGWGWPGFSRLGLWRQDKGQAACAAAFVQALRAGGQAPIALAEILEVSRIAIALADPA